MRAFHLIFLFPALMASSQGEPGRKPFDGFGNTALDRRPGNKSPDESPQPSGMPARGTALDQRPATARFATPPPYTSTLPPLPGAGITGLSFEAKTRASSSSRRVDKAAPAAFPQPRSDVVAKDKTVTLDIRLRNVSHLPQRGQIEWYFLAQSVRTNTASFIWDQGSREVTVEAGSEQTETVISKEITQTATYDSYWLWPTDVNGRPADSRRATPSPITTRETDGDRPFGWIVRMLVDGKLARVQASSHALELVGRDPAQLDGLLSKKAPPPVAPAARNPLPAPQR